MPAASAASPPSGASLAGLFQSLTAQFSAVTDTPALEAGLLVEHVTGLHRSVRYARPETRLPEADLQRLTALSQRRLAGEPMAYILGSQGFRNLILQVSPAVLIPRPETELLVERCLLHLSRAATPARAVDLGTGSGAIALALADEAPAARVCGVDRSPEAMAVARGNGEHLGLNVEWLLGDWFAPLGGRRFAVIASNPPYVAERDPHLAMGDVRFEPQAALKAGADGMRDLRTIIRRAPEYLEPGGWLVVEHGFDQEGPVSQCFLTAGFKDVATFRDIAGQPRVTEGRWRR